MDVPGPRSDPVNKRLMAGQRDPRARLESRRVVIAGTRRGYAGDAEIPVLARASRVGPQAVRGRIVTPKTMQHAKTWPRWAVTEFAGRKPDWAAATVPLPRMASRITAKASFTVARRWPGERTSGRVDGMISACATSGEYASFQSQRAEAKRTQKRSETGMEE
jgi:hypothetical protein